MIFALDVREAYTTLAASVRRIESDGAPTAPNALSYLVSDTPASKLPTLDQAQYPQINFWTRIEFNQKKPPRNSNDRGNAARSKGENVSLFFVEDARGKPISANRATYLSASLRSIFHYLKTLDAAPATYGTAPWPAREYIRSEMYKVFPELRLCADDWKLDHIATEMYPSWYASHITKARRTAIKVEVDNSDDYPDNFDEESDMSTPPKKRSATPLPLIKGSKKVKTSPATPAQRVSVVDDSDRGTHPADPLDVLPASCSAPTSSSAPSPAVASHAATQSNAHFSLDLFLNSGIPLNAPTPPSKTLVPVAFLNPQTIRESTDDDPVAATPKSSLPDGAPVVTESSSTPSKPNGDASYTGHFALHCHYVTYVPFSAHAALVVRPPRTPISRPLSLYRVPSCVNYYISRSFVC